VRKGEWLEDREEEWDDPLCPSAGRVFARALGFCYDHLTLTLIVNLSFLCFGVLLWTVLPPYLFTPHLLLRLLRFGALFMLAYGVFALPTGLVHRALGREEWSPADLAPALLRYTGRGYVLGLISGGVAMVIVGDLYFFLTRPSPYLRLVSVPFGYLFLLWALAQPYGLPLAVRGIPPFRASRQMVLFVLDNPVFTGTVSFVIIALLALSFLWLPLMLLAPMPALAAGYVATQDLLRKYEALQRTRHGEEG
jgi:hypothetical protein